MMMHHDEQWTETILQIKRALKFEYVYKFHVNWCVMSIKPNYTDFYGQPGLSDCNLIFTFDNELKATVNL